MPRKATKPKIAPCGRPRTAATRAAPTNYNPILTLRLHRHDGFDLDRDLVRQRAHADSRTGVAAGVAEHFGEQIGAAIDHFRLVSEFRHGVDHAEKLHHEVDAVERAERLA